MEAKSRANFINSVVGGKKIPCPKCNTLNEAGSRFCITCGTPLAQEVGAAVCPKCGTANENGSKFCISCGALLDQDEKTAVKDAAGGVSAEVPFAQVKMEDQQVKKPETLVLPAPGVQSNTLINTKLEKSQSSLGLPRLNIRTAWQW